MRLLLKGRLEGIGQFGHEVLKRLVANYPQHQFIFLFDRAFDPEFVYGPNVTPVVLHPQSRSPLLWYVWFEWAVAYALKKHRADVFLSPDGYLSLRSAVPQVCVMHDLNFEHNPQDLKPQHTAYLRKWFPRFAAKARHVITVSEFSKQDIHERYGVALDRITVAYNGVNPRYSPISADERNAIRVQYADGNPYLLFVGAIHPRKNVARMLEAFDAYLAASGADLMFLFAGNKTWWTPEMEAALNAMRFRERVKFLGRVSQDQLHQLLPAAHALMYVSTFEGFGMPIVEGFQAGVPVITSTTTAMPEVAGDAAILCNPLDIDSIQMALQRLDTEAGLRPLLIKRGTLRAAHFNWDKTAQTVAEVLGL